MMTGKPMVSPASVSMRPPNVVEYSVAKNCRSNTSIKLASTKSCKFFSLSSGTLFSFVPVIRKIGFLGNGDQFRLNALEILRSNLFESLDEI